MKVIVGMSGGVDSSVTAYLLKNQGYDVEGVSFILEERRIASASSTSCCSEESLLDAKKSAEKTGIKHSMMSLRTEFFEHVISPFIEAYSKGITPNPCILCNEHIKFAFLQKIADDRGAEFISTGHYARVKRKEECGMRSSEWKNYDPLLLKGIDERKDQSYVLYVLKKKELKRLILPLGNMRKEDVREIARELELPSAKRPESQEICFVGDKDYPGFFEGLTEGSEGPIVDIETNRVLGKHKGIHLYTIGQRKRLGIATGNPLYVTRIDPVENTIYVGTKEAAMMKEFFVENLNWLISPQTEAGFKATVKVRSMMKDQPAEISFAGNGTIRVEYDEPQWAPAPGQSAVFYNGDIVIGGGIISRTNNQCPVIGM